MIIVALVVIVVVSQPRDTVLPQDNSETNSPQNEDVELNETETTQIENNDVSATGSYIPYALSSLTNGVNVIFFAASWCPSCSELDRNLNASLNSIPENLTILKTDYDNSQELREKYGVTIQHTLVQVDAAGNLIKKVTGLYNTYTLEDIITQFN